ncbi:hypothetical protein [Leptospirillum ferriphilum]|uniref:hypothetical protein n=1 Tax=Leptospirillum ferriphilum TaxID=178606 RepID=UPI000AEB95B8|nr:hypothetical protein [Leptospirillum ferriphilum]
MFVSTFPQQRKDFSIVVKERDENPDFEKTTPSPESTLACVCDDLSKNTFYIEGFDAKGSKVFR